MAEKQYYQEKPAHQNASGRFIIPIAEENENKEFFPINVCYSVILEIPSDLSIIAIVPINSFMVSADILFSPDTYESTDTWRHPKILIRETGTIVGR
jgi:hypothetical protein